MPKTEAGKRAQRNYYLRNKGKVNKITSDFRMKRRAWLNTLKKECVICGEKDPICLDFHHKNPETKVSSVGNMISTHSMKNILAELEKCIVVCANCHRKLHNRQVI